MEEGRAVFVCLVHAGQEAFPIFYLTGSLEQSNSFQCLANSGGNGVWIHKSLSRRVNNFNQLGSTKLDGEY